MGEVYSEVWVTVRCRKDPRQVQEEINDAWRKILDKYEEQGVVNDTGSMVGIGNQDLDPQLDDDMVKFGLGSHERDGGPNYEEQYQAMGEMVWRVQEALNEWDVEIEVQKTGASG